MILSTLLALLADHVMGLVTTTRRDHLTEFKRYLDEQQPRHRRRPRRTPA